ncbi:uncharacterized protein LOC112494242 isoform X1 [Cephus cinctus]|uniref:Uncharacterized protein LOC112494242 isoform X1 n=1 Tax=Cephus cinctus TaxID=211228 RepID=A0AAJ7RFQ4_CEPCN|nr:uncharacterized protein LOC112494242 isoform X1 [Cephus cinctus]
METRVQDAERIRKNAELLVQESRTVRIADRLQRWKRERPNIQEERKEENEIAMRKLKILRKATARCTSCQRVEIISGMSEHFNEVKIETFIGFFSYQLPNVIVDIFQSYSTQ